MCSVGHIWSFSFIIHVSSVISSSKLSFVIMCMDVKFYQKTVNCLTSTACRVKHVSRLSQHVLLQEDEFSRWHFTVTNLFCKGLILDLIAIWQKQVSLFSATTEQYQEQAYLNTSHLKSQGQLFNCQELYQGIETGKAFNSEAISQSL